MPSNPGHSAGLSAPKGKPVFEKQDPTLGAPTLDEIMGDTDEPESNSQAQQPPSKPPKKPSQKPSDDYNSIESWISHIGESYRFTLDDDSMYALASIYAFVSKHAGSTFGKQFILERLAIRSVNYLFNIWAEELEQELSKLKGKRTTNKSRVQFALEDFFNKKFDKISK